MKIQIKAAIKKIVSPILEPHGFQLHPSSSSSYMFFRMIGSIKQTIEFEKGTIPPKTIRLFLHTSVDIPGMTGAGLKKDAKYMYWAYQDQQTLEEALQEMVQIVVERGLAWLEVASVRIPKVPIEVERALLDNPVARAQNFARQHDLSLSDPEALHQVDEWIIQQIQKFPEGNWDLLLDIGAFFGEYTIHQLEGHWEWDDLNHAARIRGMGGKPRMKERVMSLMVLTWYRSPFQSLHGFWMSVKFDAHSPYRYCD